jgi:hypothetical protein
MYGSRRFRFTALLTVGVLVAALVAPAVTFAGEPVPGAEVFLQQEPPYELMTYSGGTEEFGAYGDVVFPEGAVLTNTTVDWTVYGYSTPMTATNGQKVLRAVKLEASNPVFEKPVTLSLAEVPGYVNQTIFGWNETTDVWEPMPSRARDARRVADLRHFSWYGIGGDPVTSTPASSDWSLALLALAGVGLGSVALYRKRRISLG